MKLELLTLPLTILLLHCGPAEEGELAENFEYVAGEDDEDPERAEYGLDDSASAFEAIAQTAIFQRLVSRVELVASPDCPATITPGLDVPWRCLIPKKGRHTIVGDVDNMSPDDVVRFHRLRDALGLVERSVDFGCPNNLHPNGHVDLHSRGVRKFVLAGWNRINGGGRRYEVLYRRKADGSYRLLPARPNLLSGEWRETKPNRPSCMSPAD